MAVHFTFAASKTLKSVPCVGYSLSLLELKDAIAAPLVAALHGKKLREHFDFRVYDADTKEEIVGANARVRRNASVLVKRVPAYVISQQNQPPVVVPSRDLKAVNKGPENVVVDDGFGEDVYSSSAVSTVTTVSSDEVETIEKDIRETSKKEEATAIDGDFREGVCPRPTANVVSSEEVEEDRKEIRISRNENEKTGAWNETVGDIPEELMCTLCKHIMKDPTLIPCCCHSFCHNCIKAVLLGEKKCPNCESLRCNDADLLPNRHLKFMIDAFCKSNPSVSSKGSCSSETTSSQVFVGNMQQETTHKMFSNQDTHKVFSNQDTYKMFSNQDTHKMVSNQDTYISESVGSGLIGKRKPLIISLSGDSKRTKIL